MDPSHLRPLVPITYYALANIAFSYSLHSSKQVKILAFPIMLLLAISSLRTASYWPGQIPGLWGLLMTTWLAHTNSVLWLEDHNLLTHPKRLGAASSKDSHHASWLWDNPRLIGTRRTIMGEAGVAQQPRSTRNWALGRLVYLVFLVVLYINQELVFPGLVMDMTRADFQPDQEVFIRRIFNPDSLPIQTSEVKMRSLLAVWWAMGTYLGLTISHLGLALFFVVVLRTDRPEDWPELFGSIMEATSIRRFWSKFWHRIVVRSFTNYGLMISRRILRVRAGSSVEQMVSFFIVFLLSGISHSVVAWQLGDRCGWARDTMWFCGNFVAGLAETVVLQLLRRISQMLGYGKMFDRVYNGSVGKTIGYAWVFLFFFWSVPKWLYPKIDCLIEDAIVAQAVN